MTTDSQNMKQDPNETTLQTNKQSKVVNKLNDALKFRNASAKLGWLY